MGGKKCYVESILVSNKGGGRNLCDDGGSRHFRDSGFGTGKAPSADSGLGIRDSGLESHFQDSGFGIRDGRPHPQIRESGFGIRDLGFGTGKAPSSDAGFGIRDSCANHILDVVSFWGIPDSAFALIILIL